MLRLLEDAESVDYTTLAITTLFLGGTLSASSYAALGEGFWTTCKNYTHRDAIVAGANGVRLCENIFAQFDKMRARIKRVT